MSQVWPIKIRVPFFYNEYNGGPERRSIYDNVLDEFRAEIIEELSSGSRSINEILTEYEDKVKAVIEDQKSWIEG